MSNVPPKSMIKSVTHFFVFIAKICFSSCNKFLAVKNLIGESNALKDALEKAFKTEDSSCYLYDPCTDRKPDG